MSNKPKGWSRGQYVYHLERLLEKNGIDIEIQRQPPTPEITRLSAENSQYRDALEKVKTYAQELERLVNGSYCMLLREQLGINDEMARWIIPDEHRALIGEPADKPEWDAETMMQREG